VTRVMKPIQCIVGLSAFLLSIFSVACGNIVAQESYPDYLGDDWIEQDLLSEPPTLAISDPLEPMNRVFFEFNDKLYEWVLKPVTTGYMWVLPLELRESFGNFFLNIAMPVRLLSSLLQGDLEKSGVILERFLINSTVGVYGLTDVANEEFGIKPKRADFGQTLGKWGMGEGIYFCWPVFGPSNVRDSVGLVVDTLAHPVRYVYDDTTLDVAYYTVNRVNSLSLNPNAYEDMKRYALDPYVASRQAYYEYRKAIVEEK